jgi:hypothetical protein
MVLKSVDAGSLADFLEADFDLTPPQVSAGCAARQQPLDVLFTEAMFETMLPWRDGVSVPVRGHEPRSAHELLQESWRSSLLSRALRAQYRSHRARASMGGAGRVFESRRRLPGFPTAWRFVLRRSALPTQSPRRSRWCTLRSDRRLTDVLGAYAERMTMELASSPPWSGIGELQRTGQASRLIDDIRAHARLCADLVFQLPVRGAHGLHGQPDVERSGVHRGAPRSPPSAPSCRDTSGIVVSSGCAVLRSFQLTGIIPALVARACWARRS